MTPPALLVLVGPHGAGKSTLGRRVAQVLGWRFDDELGDRLRREALLRDPGAHALIAQPDFNLEVFRSEMNRDLARCEPCVVETWHPGNLAYARHRSPTVAAAAAPHLRAYARRAAAVVQPVRTSRETAVRRCREPGPDTRVDWFLTVGADAIALATAWGLCVLPELRSDELDPDAAVQQILAAVRRGRS